MIASKSSNKFCIFKNGNGKVPQRYNITPLIMDRSTNTAVGGAIAYNIDYIKAILARGGASQIREYVLIPPSLKNFTITTNPVVTS